MKDEDDLLGKGYIAFNAKNYEDALDCWKKCAAIGNMVAQSNLGGMYYQGIGVEKNHELAAHYTALAAKQGYVEAIFWLGKMYKEGHGVGQDCNLAVNLISTAANNSHILAQTTIADMF